MSAHVISRAAGSAAPRQAVPGRTRGTLDVITDSERRTLRPIGTTARDVADRTGALLACLSADPAVWIFQGVRSAGQAGPPIAHAISVGREVMLIESVAWPPGHYTALASGDVHCDGRYIGQSVRQLMSAVRHWQQMLPRDYRVSALIVVHPTAQGGVELPAASDPAITWAHAQSALAEICARTRRRGHDDAKKALAALFLATAGPG